MPLICLLHLKIPFAHNTLIAYWKLYIMKNDYPWEFSTLKKYQMHPLQWALSSNNSNSTIKYYWYDYMKNNKK